MQIILARQIQYRLWFFQKAININETDRMFLRISSGAVSTDFTLLRNRICESARFGLAVLRIMKEKPSLVLLMRSPLMRAVIVTKARAMLPALL